MSSCETSARSVIEYPIPEGRLYRRDATIHQIFEDQAARTPDSLAVVCGARRLSYRELNRRANQLARHLQSRGLKKNGRVAISSVRSLETIIGLLAILKAGGAYVPLNFEYPEDWIRDRLQELQPVAILAQCSAIKQLRELHDNLIPLDDEAYDKTRLATCSGENLDAQAAAADLAYVMFTSGSTGEPKGVEVPHRGVVRLLCEVDYVALNDRCVALFHSPLSFDASTFEIWAPLFHGGRLVILPPGDPTPGGLEETLKRNQVTTLWLTASLFNLMIDERPEALSGVRELLVGGEALSMSHVRKALELLPATTLINGYGPTESTTFTCCYRIPRALDASLRSVPIGVPIANTTVSILNEDGEPVADGETGELYISGDGLARGYWNRPQLTAERFVSNPIRGKSGGRMYRSGDLARYLEDGVIEFRGRVDRQVKIRGFRIEPGEIEAVLGHHPEIRRIAVITREDTKDAQRLVAYLVLADGAEMVAEKFLAFVRQRLPDYMTPAEFIQVADLPLTANGKIDASALPSQAVSLRPSGGIVAPRSELEQRLSGIWKEILKIGDLGVTDRFSDLGGTSLQGLRLIVHIERVFGKRLHPGQLSGESTIEKLARLIGEEVNGYPGLTTLRPNGTERPLFCFPGIGGDVSCFQKLADSLGGARGVQGVFFPDFGREENNPRTMEELAAYCWKEMQRAQPDGPYFLAGYSFGGSVAYEVAQQIAAEGKGVAMLALLDADLNAQPLRNDITRFLLKARGIASWPLRKKLSYITGSMRKCLRSLVSARDSKATVSADSEEFVIAERIVRYQCVALGLYCAYKQRPFDGRILIFRVEKQTTLEALAVRNSLSYWRSLAKGGIEAYTVSGDHDTMFVEPHVDDFAKIMCRCLAEAQRRHGGKS